MIKVREKTHVLGRSFLQVVCFFSVFLVSCAGRSAMRHEKLMDATLRNDFSPAIDFIKKNPRLYGNTNRFLYNMDIGALFHYGGNYDSSSLYLNHAVDVYNELFTRSVTNEAAAVMINDNVRPYRSRPFELVLLHQFLAFNYLLQSKPDAALVESRRVQLLFNEWERKDKKEEKYSSDGMFHYVSSIAYDAVGESDNAMISLFKSIQAFRKGPVALPASIKDHAYYMLQHNDRASDNELLGIKPDLPKERIQGIENNQSEIILIGYAGRGPSLSETVWWGTYVKDGLLVIHHRGADGKPQTVTMGAPPLPETEQKKAEKGQKTSSGETFHIKFALPALNVTPSITNDFQVRCSGIEQAYTSVVINDLDKQAEAHFEDTRAATLSRTVIRVVLRTIAAQRTKANLQTNNSVANLLLNVGTDILADQMERADTRSCFLIPKTIQIVRIPVKPGKYSLDVTARDKAGNQIGAKTFTDIEVKRNEKKFLYYASFK